jgi:hypothetical protein
MIKRISIFIALFSGLALIALGIRTNHFHALIMRPDVLHALSIALYVIGVIGGIGLGFFIITALLLHKCRAPHPMVTACSYCGRYRIGGRWTWTPPRQNTPLSHGSCPECTQRELRKIRESIIKPLT